MRARDNPRTQQEGTADGGKISTAETASTVKETDGTQEPEAEKRTKRGGEPLLAAATSEVGTPGRVPQAGAGPGP
jgi:hypothetical protein